VDRIVAASAGPRVIDVGCGTGIAADCLGPPAAKSSASILTLAWPTWPAGGGFTMQYTTVAVTAARVGAA
jgi:hypothetical protein